MLMLERYVNGTILIRFQNLLKEGKFIFMCSLFLFLYCHWECSCANAVLPVPSKLVLILLTSEG